MLVLLGAYEWKGSGARLSRALIGLVGAFELAHVEVVVESSLLQQLRMGAAFDYSSPVYYQYLICVAYRAEAVGDYKAGPALHEP